MMMFLHLLDVESQSIKLAHQFKNAHLSEYTVENQFIRTINYNIIVPFHILKIKVFWTSPCITDFYFHTRYLSYV